MSALLTHSVALTPTYNSMTWFMVSSISENQIADIIPEIKNTTRADNLYLSREFFTFLNKSENLEAFILYSFLDYH